MWQLDEAGREKKAAFSKEEQSQQRWERPALFQAPGSSGLEAPACSCLPVLGTTPVSPQ